MPRARTALPALAALAVALAASPGLAARAAPATPTISVETLKDVTKTLSSDAYEGRAPTTPAEEKTVGYIAARFAMAGLKPGAHGSWYQAVPLVETTVDPKLVLHIAGGKAPLDFAYKTDVVLSTKQVTPRIDIANSDVIFVGYGIVAPEKGWNDYARLDVHGKTVVVLVNDPDWKTPTVGGLFNGRAMTYYGRWTYKFEEAARQGAAAVLIVHDTEPAAYPFDVVVSSWSGPQLEIDATDNHMGESKAVGWITNAAAHRLFAAAGKDYDQLVAAAGTKGFKAVPLGLTASTGFDVRIRRQASRNVVGILPGRRRPEDYILYTAHWDHLGHCEPVNGDDICNGALDNASGVAGLVALAEAAVKAGPAARSQIFMSVTAEESGLLGSAYYAANPLYPLKKTVGGVNMDVLSVNGLSRTVAVTGLGKSELDDYVRSAAAAQGRTIVAEADPEKGHYYRSDHFSFAKLGVPMVDAASGNDLVNGGVAAGKAAEEDYTTHRYHKPQDEYDPNWDWAGAQQDLAMYLAIGQQLANSTAWPNWFPTDEFRAIRDASRAHK